MATASVHSLYLAYPCSVDAGVDPVKYTEEIIRRIHKIELNDLQAAQTLRRELSSLMPRCDMSSSDEELTRNAETLKKSWGHAVHEDKTMMEDDMKDVAECSERMKISFIQPHQPQDIVYNEVTMSDEVVPMMVINEFLDEHISNVRAFLTCITVPRDGTTRFLYLCGHGLSGEDAEELHDNPADDKSAKTPDWPWDWPWTLCSCKETMSRKPSVVTGEALKGDIVVFSSGLLTPEWVVEKLQKCEEDQLIKNKIHNTIIIVIDACYSGTWVTRIRECLKKQPLQYTRVIVQTSCGEDEVCYGGCFTPVFCALQDPKKCAELQKLYEKDKDAMEGIGLFYEQTPTIYDSKSDPKLPSSFYFIHDVEFFNFCRKYFTIKIKNWDTLRGIPIKEYSQFFASFSSDHPPKTLCFRLNRMKDRDSPFFDSPLAFFLVEWNEKKLYHIHLHFNNFKDMKLTGVSHVDVIDGKGYYQYTEKDPKKNKKHITAADHVAWVKHVEKNEAAMVEYFKNIVEEEQGKQWNNQSSWNMEEALPDNLIRSRSAYFQEAKEKCTEISPVTTKFKTLLSSQ